MLSQPLTNFEIFIKMNLNLINAINSRNNLPKIKDWAYVINLDEFKYMRTHWILYVSSKNIIYFDSFGLEHIPKEIMKFIRNKNVITNIYRIQTYGLIICRYFCTGFIDFMLNGKSLLDYINLFSPSDYENNDKVILKYFQ